MVARDEETAALLHSNSRARAAIAPMRGARRRRGEDEEQQLSPEEEDAQTRGRRGGRPQLKLELEPPAQTERQRFPLMALPGAARMFCQEAARSLQAEPDMIGLFCLGAMSGAIGFSRRVYLKSGWTPSANIWVAAVADPGMLKSPSLKAAADPIYRHQERLLDEYDDKKSVYDKDLSEWEQKTSERGERPAPPTASQHLIVDTTIEALATLLSRNLRGLSLVRDELSGWIRGMGEYKGGGGHDRSDWLSTWSTDAPIIVNRQRAEYSMRPLTVWHPCVSIFGGLQPTILPELRQNEAQDDGMMDRFLFGFPSPVGRSWTEDTVSDDTQQTYDEMFTQLLLCDMQADKAGKARPKILAMDRQAKAAWVDLYNQHHAEAAAASFDMRLAGVYSKMDEQAMRLGLIVHCGRYAEGSTESEALEERSVISGWALADYFKDGAMRARELLGSDAATNQIERILSWMKKHGQKEITLHEMVSSRLVREASEGRFLMLRMQDRGICDFEETSKSGKLRYTIRLSNRLDPAGILGDD